MSLTTRLPKDLLPFCQQQKEEEEEEGSISTYALTGHTTQKQKNKLLSNEVMFPTHHTKEREARKKRQCAKRNVLLQKTSDGS